MDLFKYLRGYGAKRMSDGEIRVKCPFRENHEDGSGMQSMFLNEEKGVYHCFSCKERGSLFSLLTKRLGVPLFTAAEYVVMDFDEKEDVEDFCREFTPEHPIPINLSEYYLSRGFSQDTLKKLKIYQTIKDGQDTLLIPFYQDNKLVAIYERNILTKHDSLSKGFNKAAFLFNEPSSSSISELIFVEGPADVCAFTDAGFGDRTCGLLGTVFTVNMYRRITKKFRNLDTIFLAQDNDRAGLESKLLMYNVFKNTHDVYFLDYRESDPAECSNEELKRAFKYPKEYFDIMLENEVPEDRLRKIENAAREILLHGK